MNHPLILTTGQQVEICCRADGRKIPVAPGTVERLTKTRAIVRNDRTGNESAYRLSDGGRVGGGDYCVTAQTPAPKPSRVSRGQSMLARAMGEHLAKRTAESRTPFKVEAQAFHDSRTNPGAARVAMQRSEADLRGNAYLMAD